MAINLATTCSFSCIFVTMTPSFDLVNAPSNYDSMIMIVNEESGI